MTKLMKAKIQKKLFELEKTREITILYACESGSRAWGFGSPDSDYDVRFIYVKPMNWYLSIEQHKEVIDLPIDEHELDFSGWELRKLLGLFRKSNAAPFEWLQSPMVYHEKATFRERLWALSQDYFLPKVNVHHYLGVAKNTYRTEVGGYHIKIKKYFYILRPLFAAMWVLQYGTIPPMAFHLLRKVLHNYPAIDQLVETLVQQKMQANEGDLTPILPELQVFIMRQFEACTEAAKQLPTSFLQAAPLNVFFRTMIQENDHSRLT